jgi:hypothetical protein
MLSTDIASSFVSRATFGELTGTGLTLCGSKKQNTRSGEILRVRRGRRSDSESEKGRVGVYERGAERGWWVMSSDWPELPGC